MSDRILYLEGSSGISGDMTVSALLDLGADREHMKREIAKLPLEGYRLVIGRTEKCGIDACAFFVEMDAAKPQPARNYRQIRQMLEESQLDPKVKERALAIFGVLAEAEAAVHGTTPEQVHFHEVGAVDSLTLWELPSAWKIWERRRSPSAPCGRARGLPGVSTAECRCRCLPRRS